MGTTLRRGRACSLIAILAAGGAATACSEDRRVVGTLAQAGADLYIWVELERGMLTASIEVPDADCIELRSAFTGHLEGASAPQVWPGVDNGPDFGCVPAPSLTFTTLPTTAPATLVVADDTRTIEIALGDRLLARSGTLTSPADARVAPGTEMIFDWSPATDLTADPSLARFQVIEHSFVTGRIVPAPLSLRDGHIVATAPASADIPAGMGELWLMSGSSATGAPLINLPCPGATCSMRHLVTSNIFVTFE